MTATTLVPAYPRPPAQIEVFVEILGVDLTVKFLLKFGGAELYFAKDPKSRSRLVAFVGPERAKALGQVTERLQRRGAFGKAMDSPISGLEGLVSC